MQRALGPVWRKFRSFARPSIDLLRLASHYEIGSIRADAFGQFLERARNVFGNPLHIHCSVFSGTERGPMFSEEMSIT